jgi:hypothetical protein
MNTYSREFLCMCMALGGVLMILACVLVRNWANFLDCPARAEAKHLLGLRTPSSGAATRHALHRSTAVYDKSTIAAKA